ncbi:MAG: TatD family hydrolase, partial [Clostridia bacterium]|nr:TatD family hydrolase [Clostridia bacterium]
MLDLPNYTFQKALITDTHAHYDDKRYNEDYDKLFSALSENGVDRIINCGCDIKSSEICLNLSDKYSLCYTAVGYHPSNLPKGDINLLKIEEL